jgi:aspartate/methionine/tyrosine aminotransferase
MPAEIEPFRAVSISRLAHELIAAGRSVIHMEFGQPSTGAPAAAIAAAHAVLDSDPMGYWESPELRARIARHYADEYGVAVEDRRIVLTCGASPALLLAIASAFDAGDRVALARPGYVSYRNTLKALHRVPVEIECGPQDRYQITAADVAALDPAPAGLIIASPANPTGTIIAPDELARIAAVCRERSITIISDEIYHGLSYGEPARSILEVAPDAWVVNSFSKYFSMVGWRLGWLVAPDAQALRARAFVGNFYLTAPSLSQHAALVAMDCRAELDGHVEVYRKNRELVLAALPGLGLQTIAPPDGAFYVWADVGHLTDDSMAFCKQMLRETGVAIAPGVDFDPVEGKRFIRISFARATADIDEGLRRLAPWFAAQSPKVAAE